MRRNYEGGKPQKGGSVTIIRRAQRTFFLINILKIKDHGVSTLPSRHCWGDTTSSEILTNRSHMFYDDFFINIVILLEGIMMWVSRYQIALKVCNVFYTCGK